MIVRLSPLQPLLDRLAPTTLLLLLVGGGGCAHVGLATSESTPAPRVHQTARIVRYEVHARDVHGLRSEMARIGPIDDGRHQFAHTWGTYAWHYPNIRSTDGCGTGPVDVELEIVQTLPSWERRSGASAATIGEWNRWLSATVEHEQLHRDILVSIARAMAERMPALPPRPTCAELDASADALGNQLLGEMRKQHAELDRVTRHGATTGALLGDLP